MSEATEKKCPFCGEMIKAEAVKCRFCGEFLEPQAAAGAAAAPHGAAAAADEILFDGIVSSLAVARPAAGTALLVALVAALWVAAGRIAGNAQARQVIGLACLAVIAFLLLRFLWLWLDWRSWKWRITTVRVETERGVLRRKTQTTDMWRVQDLSLSRTLLERMLDHGSIRIRSTDLDQPDVTIGPLRRPRPLFDRLEKAKLDADRRRGVLHIDK